MNSPTKVAPSNTPPRCTYRKFDHKEKLRCRFCRGENCIRCGKEAYKQCTKEAIPMFHCNWIFDSVMAMQRPSDELFDTIMLIEAFQSNGITAVINLCEPGEHPYCGYPLKSSGFPYTPERLMAAGIKYFNFYWQDMTAPSLPVAQNTIRVALTEILKGGKVAVHCHAGYGRTGIVVACLALILQQLTAAEAVALVRERRPGSVQTTTQMNFVKHFHDVYHRQACIYPTETKKSVTASMDDELLNPPLHLHLATPSALSRSSLLVKENLPNTIRVSAVILLYLAPQLGKVGLSLALARLSLSPVKIDRSVTLCTLQSSQNLDLIRSPGMTTTPVRGFLKDNKVQPNSTGVLVCDAPEDTLSSFKSLANKGKWKDWFSMPSPSPDAVGGNSDETVPEGGGGPEQIVGSLRDEDYDQQHIDVETVLAPFVKLKHAEGGVTEGDSDSFQTPVKNAPSGGGLSDEVADEGSKASSDLVSFMACHGNLLLDWFDTRADALFPSELLRALRALRLGDYGPYYFSRRGDVMGTASIKSPQKLCRKLSPKGSFKGGLHRASRHSRGANSLDEADEESLNKSQSEGEERAADLDELLRDHMSKPKLMLLEAVIAVLSPLFEVEAMEQKADDEGTEQSTGRQRALNARSDSEVSIFLVCAEIRVALSMCQHFGKLPALLLEENNGIDREAIEDLFGKGFLSYDANPKSRGVVPPVPIVTESSANEDSAASSFPARGDFESLDDVITLVNTLRFLSVHKWSALGDSFLACSMAGVSNQMHKSMLSTRQKNVFWNEEWLD